ncbi:hypothetical protein FH063_003947 [Azospirillum argentinense]|uniref:Uncharacterized protein n=1 Tax=Azospirillum argentinense TaxID=2970906 RepID=A0A5B0L1E7_9PROT|nr:hypothetical protein FH063_003947 [Azospirillum argentinense]
MAQIGAELGPLALQRGQFAHQFRPPALQHPYCRVVIHGCPLVSGAG